MNDSLPPEAGQAAASAAQAADSDGGAGPGALRMLWSFLHPHRRTLGISLLLALAGSAAELATPMVAKLLMDGFTDPGGPSLTPLWLLIGLMAAGGAVGLVYAVLIGTAAERIVLDARTALVNRFFGASPLRLLRRPAGELVTRVTSDTVLLREAASSSVVSLVNGGVLLAGTLLMMGLLDLVLLGVAAASITVVTALFLTLMPAIARAQQKAQDSLGRMGGVLDGALRALRTVKAGGAERQLSERILADARESARHGIRSVRVEAVGWTIAGTGIQLAIIAILGVGALRVADGAIEVSTLVAFLLYSFNLLFPVMEIAQSVTTLQSGIAAARRIREVEDIPLEPAGPGGGAPGAPDSPAEPAAPAALPEAASGLHVRRLSASGSTGPAAGAPPVLSLRGVTARYAPGAPEVLRGVDLDIPRRGHTALVGPSGAGKTSLFSVFLRFLEPEQGTVALDGRRYAELAPAEVRRRFAYVEQDTPVLPGSVRDNLLLTRPDAGDAEICAVLDEVHLLDTVDALDGGLDAPLSGDAVSGGQRQRLAVARALLADPDVLLLDEATAQVDAVTEAAITAALRSRAERGAVVTIAHRLSTVIGADRIAVLDGGRVRAEGTHGALLPAHRSRRGHLVPQQANGRSGASYRRIARAVRTLPAPNATPAPASPKRWRGPVAAPGGGTGERDPAAAALGPDRTRGPSAQAGPPRSAADRRPPATCTGGSFGPSRALSAAERGRRPPRNRAAPGSAKAGSRVQSAPRISALVGTPVPAVATTLRTPSGWLAEVPRTSRTASAIPFMPCRYASPSWPPWVLTGSRPPSSSAPERTSSTAPPGPQNPSSSSCGSTSGVKWSYRIAAWMSSGPKPLCRHSCRAATPISGSPAMSAR